MMDIRTRVVLLVILIAAFIALNNMVKKKSLDIKYYLPWFLAIFLLFIVVMIPGILAWFSNLLGIGVPVNMVFFFGFIFSLLIIFSLTIAMSRNADRIRSMAQKIAMLEKEIEDMKKDL